MYRVSLKKTPVYQNVKTLNVVDWLQGEESLRKLTCRLGRYIFFVCLRCVFTSSD